jgi:hypothetical protein
MRRFERRDPPPTLHGLTPFLRYTSDDVAGLMHVNGGGVLSRSSPKSLLGEGREIPKDAGATAYLSKPYSPFDRLRLIRKNYS